MPAPLEGVSVLDLSLGPVAGIATMVLADFGAEVVRFTPPGGDPFAVLPNAPAWLRGKRLIAADLHTAEGRKQVRELAAAADVLVTTLSPLAATEVELGADSLTKLNPRLVYCRITGWGLYGPYAAYPAYEGLVAAKSGRMQAFAGLPAREGPAYAAVQVASHAASQAAATGILAALYERETSGLGQVVDTSLLQGMLPYDLLALLRTHLLRRNGAAFANDPMMLAGRGPTLNYHPLPTKDGKWLQMGNLLQHLFDNYVAAVDLADIYGDPRYEGAPASWEESVREEFRDRMLRRMLEHTAAEWMETFVENGGVAATVYRPTQDALDDLDLVMNGHVVEREVPGLGPVSQLGPVAALRTTPGKAAAPAFSSDEAPQWKVPALRSIGHQAEGGPLAGVTVVEFATVIAAPLGVSFLGDLGARVIKVEPVGGDPYRGLGMFGIMASKTNVSKESIALDLKSPEGRQVVERLIARADVVIHNYRPGVPERLGIGYEQCKAVRPEIVYLAVNGYGPDGPGAHRPSTHPVPGAAVGGALLQAGGPAVARASIDVAELRSIANTLFRANEANPDPNTSVVVATAALLALVARKRLGVGQQVFVDMLGANAWANGDDFIRYAGKPERPAPGPDLLGLSATYRLYRASQGWVFLALPQQSEFEAFAAAAGATGLASDPRFATATARASNDGPLAEALSAVLAARTADEWEVALAPNGIGCVRADGPLPGEFWLDDPHVQENRFVVPVRHARYGDSLRWGTLSNFSRTPEQPGPGCLAGDHTTAILQELGYSEDAVARLRASGVAWSEAVAPFTDA